MGPDAMIFVFWMSTLNPRVSLIVQSVKILPAMQDIWSLISSGEGNGNLLQYSCLENSMDRGTWQASVHGVTRVRHDWVTKPPPPLIKTTNIILLSIDCNFKAENDIDLHRMNIIYWIICTSSVQFSSVTQSSPTLCNPMDCSTPGFPVHHQFPELTQTHVHQVGDAIQTSHPLLSPSPPAFNPSQHQVFSNESFLLSRWQKKTKICTKNFINFNSTGCRVVN